MKILITVIALASSVGAISGEESPTQASPSAAQAAQVFTLSRPVNGRYTQKWDKDHPGYARDIDILTIKDNTFRYEYSVDEEPFDHTGKLQVFEDHIFLDHPEVPYPYRVSGILDGVPVLLTWQAYQTWKKNKQDKSLRYYILYLQKPEVDVQKPDTAKPESKPADKAPAKDQPSPATK